MTPDEYRDAIAALGLSQVRAAAALGADPRTSRRWARDGPPPPVSVALATLLFVKSLGFDPLTIPAIAAALKDRSMHAERPTNHFRQPVAQASSTPTTLRDRILCRLENLGLTPQAASLRAGLNRDAIRNVLRGGTGGANMKTVIALAPVLGVSVEWLSGASDIMTRAAGSGALTLTRARVAS